MTSQTLRRTLLVAFGAGVLASAGQLGLGYGLGVLRFGRAFNDVGVNHWPAQLAWLAWFAMAAAVVGALVSIMTNVAGAGRATNPPVIRVRLATAAAAALGGAAVAPLSMVPAQAVRLPSGNPVLVTGISATLGAVVGLFAALAVLGPRPIRWNLAGAVCAGWLLALVSVVPSLGPTDPMPAVRLGVFDPVWLSVGLGQRLAIVTMPALALVAGAVTGGLARWRGDYRLAVVATCGAAGPALLSLSYLIAGPGSGADRYQAAPYWGALAATATGLLGSVLAATIRWPLRGTDTQSAADAANGDTPGVRAQDEPAQPDGSAPTRPDNPAPAPEHGSPVPVPDARQNDAGQDTAGRDTVGRDIEDRDAEGLAGNRTDDEPDNPDRTGDRTGDPPASPKRTNDKRANQEQKNGQQAVEQPTTGPAADGGRTRGEPTDPVPRQRERRERRTRGRSEPEVSAADAEYVDWVSGLRGRRGTERADPSGARGPTSPRPPGGGAAQ